jgi:hypothetical protein
VEVEALGAGNASRAGLHVANRSSMGFARLRLAARFACAFRASRWPSACVGPDRGC